MRPVPRSALCRSRSRAGGRGNFLRRSSSRRIMTDTGSVIIATSIIVCGNSADGGTVAV